MITRGLGPDQRLIARGFGGRIQQLWKEIVQFSLRVATKLGFTVER